MAELNAAERLLEGIKSFGAGMIKGNTVDTLGAPVDLINEATAPIQKALGIYEPNAFLGSNHLREVFGFQQSEKDNLMETGGGLLSIGGPVQAMIVGARRLGKVDKVVNFEKAQELATKHPEVNKGSVYNMTGVYQDTDGKFKSVISDQKADLALDFQAKTSFSNPNPAKLSEVLEHEELYNLYPELKDIPVRQVSLGKNVLGTKFHPDANNPYGRIGVKEMSDVEAADPKVQEQIVSTLLHEIQHVIQGIEGFTGGANSRQFMKINPEIVQQRINAARKSVDPDIIDAAERFKTRANKMTQEAFRKYEAVPGEQEARFTQLMQNNSTEEIASYVYNLLKEGRTPQTYATTDAKLP